MCTVIITVPDDDTQPVRLLAVRDEDPGRPWDRLGAWWPDLYPGVVGIRHRLATGEDYDALARDVLNATIAGLQSGIATTFVSCKCPEGVAGAAVPAGVGSHES